MHIFQQHLSASFNVFHKGKRQAIYEGLCKVGVGRLCPHTRSCMTAASRMDKIDRAIVLEEVWLGEGRLGVFVVFCRLYPRRRSCSEYRARNLFLTVISPPFPRFKVERMEPRGHKKHLVCQLCSTLKRGKGGTTLSGKNKLRLQSYRGIRHSENTTTVTPKVHELKCTQQVSI